MAINREIESELRTNFSARLRRLPMVRDCECWETDHPRFVARVSYHDDSSILLEGTYMERAFPAALLEQAKRAGRLVLTPQMSPKGHAICEERGLNYMDAAGNCFISLDRAYISEKGNRATGLRKRRGEQSVFEPTAHASSRILRTLMQAPSRGYRMADLAEESGCSPAQAYKVASFLRQNLLAETRGGRLCIANARHLLMEWGKVYKVRQRPKIALFSLDDLPAIEARLQKLSQSGKTRALLTGIAGGNRYAPTVRYNRLQLLCPEGETEELAMLLDCKPCSSGANVIVTPCAHDEYFMDARRIHGDAVVSPVQAYLDCMSSPARGEEQALAILRKEFP